MLDPHQSPVIVVSRGTRDLMEAAMDTIWFGAHVHVAVLRQAHLPGKSALEACLCIDFQCFEFPLNLTTSLAPGQ